MAKNALVALLLLISLTLSACGEKTTSSTNYDTGSNSQTATNTTTNSVEEAAVDEENLTLSTTSRQDITLLTHSLNWDNFVVTEINAEIEAEELQLDLTWLNRTTEEAKFSDLLKVQVFQNDEELIMTDHGNDLNDLLATDASEDVELDYHLFDLTHPLEVKIAAKNGDNAHMININLK
ncbi:hypothetical protein [Lapidilactobacillus bayanensis]|uniref:hypothetical protein n=1 Tax=Lapidilactobacillus bayanensis TaxID=2485998 RepID=UPI000F788ECC|nr:hypothetical protein [Lapidilactobacillus bayanensis]